MPQKKCLFGCKTFDYLHRFPKPEYPTLDKFEQWKRIVGKALLNKDNFEVYDNYRICNNHFEDRFAYPMSKRLSKTAIPTKNIPTSQITYSSPGTSNMDVLSTMQFEQESTMQENLTSISQIPHATPSTSDTNLETRLPLKELDMNIEHSSVKRKNKQNTTTQKKVVTFYNQNRKIKQLLQRIIKLKKKLIISRQNEVKAAKKMSTTKIFNRVLRSLPVECKTFICMQLKQHKKKSKGRRFTISEKLLSLSIFKKSPRGYNFLKQLFVLPSKRTLQNVLKLISIKPGVNPTVMEQLKKTVEYLPEEERLCLVMFDEMSLSPSLFYSRTTDEIIGFEDFGTHKTHLIADHILVFMIKGIKSKYKQPICYTFCQHSTKFSELKSLLISVIKGVNETGLKVIATVCDQTQINVRVINTLLSDTKAKYLRMEMELRVNAFMVDDSLIFPLYDTPHLLKGVRNNMLIKELHYVQNNVAKCAKWEHLKLLLQLDTGEDDLRLIRKLTEAHVLAEKIPKMKVKHAAQVFSQKVSAALRFCTRHKLLPEECIGTADILLFFDRLFDSFNGNYKDSSKIYKSCLKRNSPHFQLWAEALPILNTIRFKTPSKKKPGSFYYAQVPSIKNWIHNINTMQDLWNYLNENYSITSLLMRYFNQDPLENFFSAVRSHGVRNISPTCSQFEGIFKTLLVNNMTSHHSLGANCQYDKNRLLQSLNFLLVSQGKTYAAGNIDIVPLLDHLTAEKDQNVNIVHNETKNYVGGFIVKKCRSKIYKMCNTCNLNLCSTTPPTSDNYIFIRDVTKRSLVYPSENLVNCLSNIHNITLSVLRTTPFSAQISDNISLCVEIDTDFSFLTCAVHNQRVKSFIINLTINIIIYSWCTNINRILSGKISSFDDKDIIKNQAFIYFSTHKKKQKNK